MKYYENVIIDGSSLDPKEFLTNSTDEDLAMEMEKTFHTTETFLPAILVELGITKSRNEVRKNKPQFCIDIKRDYYHEFKWGKRKIWILG